MNEVSYIDWDSDFFKKKIAAFTISESISDAELSEKLKQARNKEYDLLYLFDNLNGGIKPSILELFNGNLVDIKVNFQKIISAKPKTHANIFEYTSYAPSESLLNLAFLSGEFSRFKIDHRFSTEDFEKLYAVWLERSVKREIADLVLVYKEEKEILGFVTLAIKNKVGKIGLIAVHPDHHGKRIGSSLIDMANSHLFDNNIFTVQVPTQKKNKQACKFYSKNGFKLLSEQSIYHFSL